MEKGGSLRFAARLSVRNERFFVQDNYSRHYEPPAAKQAIQRLSSVEISVDGGFVEGQREGVSFLRGTIM